ncbi:hypothetical protein [Cupriavidus pauculus]|uniref:hypothetical protein n=1 Tax=Cupriavidus pauculus TaxID=82633 RepID=UPI003857405F
MATEVWCELVCACCATSSFGQYTTGGRVPRKALKAMARAAGWVFAGDESFCRAACRVQHEADAHSHHHESLTTTA